MVPSDRYVGVYGASPIYVTGLVSLLHGSGYTFEIVSDPVDWVADGGNLLIVMLRNNDDLDVVVEVRESNSKALVVALVDEVNVAEVARALEAGAVGMVCREAPADELILALDAAIHQGTILPTEVVKALVSGGFGHDLLHLDEIEVDWLRQLAGEMRVSDLAYTVGYSEREMYRRLKRLYTKMGARGRTEALVKASRLGLIG